MKIYALICHKLVLTQFWPKVVSWRFEITTDVWVVGLVGVVGVVGVIGVLMGKVKSPPPQKKIQQNSKNVQKVVFIPKILCIVYVKLLILKKVSINIFNK